MKRHIHTIRLGAASIAVLCLVGCSDDHKSVSTSPFPSNPSFETVTAKQFVLKDESGHTRGRIAIDTNDVVRVRFGNQLNDGVFVLSVFPDGRAALLLRDRGNRNRIGMSLHEGGRPVLRLTENANIILCDERGRNRAVLRVPTNGEPELRLYDDRMKRTSIVPEPVGENGRISP